ncbi:hypothetical protein [Deinococcus sp. Marseille-Q6407]|uniref:hypothetical protein n=1 Tax=Deinococcus sp. Marseille-Q6407 TaxID=2969223 RepID=UPI0021C035D7|nr:hypothetical protein [Deinococcus sp. Marseille-Q6407]
MKQAPGVRVRTIDISALPKHGLTLDYPDQSTQEHISAIAGSRRIGGFLTPTEARYILRRGERLMYATVHGKELQSVNVVTNTPHRLSRVQRQRLLDEVLDILSQPFPTSSRRRR